MKIRHLLLAVLFVTLTNHVVALEVDKADKPVLWIIFFTPSDVEPPDGVNERMKEIVEYTQGFYAKWMKHWGYDTKEALPVNKNKEGYPEILYMKGEHTEASGKYSKSRDLRFRSKVIWQAAKKYNIDQKGEVWWFFMYKGPETGWGQGGGNLQRGGSASARYYTDPGSIKLEDDLGGGFLRDICFKGSIHELGHALGLPHIGPKDADKLGNSLMGPINMAYQKKYPTETRVYLSEASAAMLWKHPLFTGSIKDRNIVPKVQIEDLDVKCNHKGGTIEITGKVKSDYPVHSAIAAEESETSQGDYWTKTFASKVKKDGTFKITVDDFKKSGGKLRIVFYFDNGAIVGETTDRRGFGNGFLCSYENHFEHIVDNRTN